MKKAAFALVFLFSIALVGSMVYYRYQSEEGRATESFSRPTMKQVGACLVFAMLVSLPIGLRERRSNISYSPP